MNVKERIDLFTEHNYHCNPAAKIILKVTVSGQFQKDKFMLALNELKRVHPILNYTVQQDEDCKLFYLRTFEQGIIHTECTMKVTETDWISYVEDIEKQPFNMKVSPPLRFQILSSETDFDIILVGHHILGDGLSFTYLLDDLLEIYCNHSTSLPVKEPRLLQSLTDFPDSCTLPEEEINLIQTMNTVWEKEKKIYSQEHYEALYTGYHQYFQSNLLVGIVPKENFESFVENCKAHGIKVNTAIIMAFLHNMHTSREHVNIAVNNRRHFPFIPEKSMGNFAAMINCNLSYNSELTFWENALNADKSIQSILTDPDQCLHLMKVFATINSSVFDGMFFIGDSGLNMTDVEKLSDIMMSASTLDTFNTSNLGNVPIKASYGNYQISNIAFIAPPATKFRTNVGIVTHNGTCTISLLFKNKALEQAQMNQLMKNTIDFISTI